MYCKNFLTKNFLCYNITNFLLKFMEFSTKEDNVNNRRANFWLGIIILCLAFFAVSVPRLYESRVPVAKAVTTYTVCADDYECHFTTITTAMANPLLVAGDIITVGDTYDIASDPTGFTFATPGITLDCQNSGAVVGTSTANSVATININSTTTIRNCILSNVLITDSSNDYTDLTVTGNTFSTSTGFSSEIQLGCTAGCSDNPTITNNTGLNRLNFAYANGVDNATITGNTFDFVSTTNQAIVISGDSHLVGSNIMRSWTTDLQNIFNFSGGNSSGGLSNATIATNTIEFPTTPVTNNSFEKIITFGHTTNTIFTANYVTLPPINFPSAQSFIVIGGNNKNMDIEFTHNTFSASTNIKLLNFWVASGVKTYVTSSYNIFYNSGSSATGTGMTFGWQNDNSNFTISNDYNGFYNLSNNITDHSSYVSAGANSKVTDPYFMDDDSDTANNLHPAPFSNYLDANGNIDIGAYGDPAAADRGNSFVIDDDGTIDYSTVHATTTDYLSGMLRNSDTLTFNAGVYNAFSLSSLSSLTIAGSGADTYINGTSTASAISLSSVNNSTFRDFVVQNASSTGSTYTATAMNFDYAYNGGAVSTYDETAAFGDPEDPITDGYILLVTGNDGCAVDEQWNTDGYDVTVYVSDDWHLWLGEVFESKIGILVPDQFYSDSAALEAACAEDVGLVTHAWVSSIFQYNSGVMTYNSSAVAAAGVTLTSGMTNPPAITRLQPYGFGISIADSATNTFSNITSTLNIYGTYFAGTSHDNSVSSSVFTANTTGDIYSSATGNNNLKNTSFTNSSCSITGTGDVNVYYKARASINNLASAAIEDVGVTFTSADSSVTDTVTTTADGLTPYTDFLLAYVMDSAITTDTSNGGYNDYTMTAAAVSPYVASSTAFTLDTVNESASLTMLAPPTAPSGIATSTVGATSIVVTWTDNSSGSTQESYFLFDYVASSTADAFPGTTSSTIQDATIATTTSLIGNTQYMFRVAAVNSAGTSAYSTISLPQYTDADVPTSLAASANGQTSIIVTWTGNNGTGTVYDLAYDDGTSITATTETNYTVTGLTAGTNYTFKVRARYLSDSSQYSSYSDTASATTQAAAVTTETPSAGSGAGASAPPAPPAAPATVSPATVQVSVSPREATAVSVGNVSHTVIVAPPAADGSVEITIKSDPIIIRLFAGQERLVDTDGDEEDDIFVRLDKVQGQIVTLTLSTIGDLEFSINHALSDTNSRDVSLYFNSPQTVMMAISNTEDFSGASYQSYEPEKKWTLLSGEGHKTVYVKLRTASGGTRIVSDTINYVPPAGVVEDTQTVIDQTYSSGDCILEPNHPYKYSGHPGVYYVTEDCTKRPFNSPQKYFTYFVSWNKVRETTKATLDSVPDDTLGFMPWGSLYSPLSGTLVKTITDPKVYLLTGKSKYWIASEAVFNALKYTWNWIEDVAESFLDKYETGDEITSIDFHPNFTLIKYSNDPKVYHLEPDPKDEAKQVKRWIVDEETFEGLGFRWDRIVTVDESEIYTDGELLE